VSVEVVGGGGRGLYIQIIK